MSLSFLPLYIRLVAYAIVFVASLTHLVVGENRNTTKLVYIGNMIVALLMAISGCQKDLFGFDGLHIRNTIITPAIIIWAICHIISLQKIKK